MTTEESGFLIEEEERRKGHKTIKQFHCSDSTDLRRLQPASQRCTQNRAIPNVSRTASGRGTCAPSTRNLHTGLGSKVV